MILIIGTSVDPATAVVEELNRISDKRVIFFRSNKCLDGECLGFSCINGHPRTFLDINGESIDLNKIDCVWFWKPVLPKELRTIEPEEHRIFIYRQFLAMWRSLASLLAEKKWLNNYYKMIEAEHKPYQLSVASQMGFNVPDTLVTSNPDRAIAFWNHCEKQMVMKALMLSPMEDKVVYTSAMTEELLLGIERLKSSPVILQRKIPVQHELRITIVGDQIFPASIKGSSELDWRKSKIMAQECDLPENIRLKCFELIKRLGLQYGCIDMIVTPDNEYIFLEINPNGQWGFIQELTGMKIGEAIARLLVS